MRKRRTDEGPPLLLEVNKHLTKGLLLRDGDGQNAQIKEDKHNNAVSFYMKIVKEGGAVGNYSRLLQDPRRFA